MACSTCDGYEFVPNPDDPAGEKLDCPDCRAIDERPLVWCPTHSIRVDLDGRCRKCSASTTRERQLARDLVARARLATEGMAA